MKLVIGNKRYSSWSLRPWLMMKHLGLVFDEVLIPMYREDSKARMLEYSPSGKVPCLIQDDGTAVWDSLAIIETLADHFPTLVWPEDPRLRALGRCMCAEMHSGFSAMRTHLSMNVGVDRSQRVLPADALADVARVQELWRMALRQSGGPWLLGNFSAADAYYAPVVTRFVTYGVSVPRDLQPWCDRMLMHPDLQAWIAAGRAEPWRMPQDPE